MTTTTRLKPGDPAPDFDTCDLHGKNVQLDGYRERWLLLSFYRYASCPLCNLRVHELARKQPGWCAQGMDMLAVFQSPADRMLEYVGKQQPPFPLIPDPEQRLYALYGVGHSWTGFFRAWGMRLPEIGRSVIGRGFLPGSVEGGLHRIPADFLIAPGGTIIEAHYGKDIGDHLPVERIEHHLKEAA